MQTPLEGQRRLSFTLQISAALALVASLLGDVLGSRGAVPALSQPAARGTRYAAPPGVMFVRFCSTTSNVRARRRTRYGAFCMSVERRARQLLDWMEGTIQIFLRWGRCRTV